MSFATRGDAEGADRSILRLGFSALHTRYVDVWDAVEIIAEITIE